MPLVLANIFQPLIDVFEAVLKFFHNQVGFGWGLSIIALTVLVRALLIPLTLRQFRSMQALQKLQPEIKALQAKYKDDKQRLNQEMMRFYQENKVNPLGSCLPLAAQLPVFIGLFYMLRKDLRINICPQVQVGLAHGVTKPCGTGVAQAHFLFINDITNSATGAVLVVLIVLYVGSQLLSSLLMSTSVDRNQRLLMLGLPFFFTFLIIGFPAGLILYWITTNVWTIFQQYVVRRRVGPMRPALAAVVGADAAAGGGSSGGGGGSSGGGAGGGLGALLRSATGRQQTNGKADGAPADSPREPAGARSGGNGDGSGRKPPPPPRKRKQRSGRRR